MQKSEIDIKRKSLPWGLAIILLLMLVIAYSNHFKNGFQFDDDHTIVQNEYIRHIKNLPLFFTDIKYFGTNVYNQTYRPVVASFNAIDYWLAGGLNPVYFHADIFLSYIALLVLLFFFFKGIFRESAGSGTGSTELSIVALLAVGFYGLHAANAETINYIIQRADSFSTLLIVASLLLYINSRARKFYLYLITIGLAFITKETGIITCLLLFFYILLFEENTSLSELISFRKFKSIFSALRKSFPALLFSYVIFNVVQYHFVWSRPIAPVNEKLPAALNFYATEAVVIIHYIGNFLLPVNLSISSGFTIYASLNNPKIFFAAALIAALVIIAFLTSKKKEKRPIAFGIVWFFVALVPTTFLVKTGELSNDHRTFLPYIGLVMSLAWWLRLLYVRCQIKDKESAAKNRKIAPVLAKNKSVKGNPSSIAPVQYGNKYFSKILVACYFVIISLHAYGTYQRNIVWSSYENLWQDALLKNPDESMALMNYGLVLMDKGRQAEALSYFERVLKQNPEWAYINVNMGILKDKMGKPLEAEGYFKDAIRFQPFYPMGFYYYARFLLKYGRTKEAITNLEAGLKISPGDVQIIDLLNKTRAETPESKLAELNNMAGFVEQHPSASNYLKLSIEYYKYKMYRECIGACEKALKLNPASAMAYNNICGCYNALGQWAKAEEACMKSLQIEPTLQLAKNNLVVAQRNLK